MRDQEILGLMEAYSSIYAPQEELTEEVQIAAQYFYEMGLNEDGVDILIEELGVEEFGEFVYDIAEEYVLTEARAGGVKIEPKLASGKAIQGKPKAASLKRLRAQKAERSAGEQKTSAAKPSGMKASLQRQSAVAAAAKKQPKKPGLLDRVAGAVNRGIERHNAAMGELKKMGAATSVTAGKVKKAAGEFKKGLTSEEMEVFGENTMASRTAGMSSGQRDAASSNVSSGVAHRMGRRTDASAFGGRKSEGKRGQPTNYRAGAFNNGYGPSTVTQGKSSFKNFSSAHKEEFEGDLFDYLLEYLVAEGYADTNKAALAIMANMSEEWKQSILEEVLDEGHGSRTSFKKQSADERWRVKTFGSNYTPHKNYDPQANRGQGQILRPKQAEKQRRKRLSAGGEN